MINVSQYQKQLFRQYLIILNICSGWQLLQKAEHETMTYKSEHKDFSVKIGFTKIMVTFEANTHK